MKMILLLLGWNLSLLGLVTILLGWTVDSLATGILGLCIVLLGIFMSLILRKTCSSFRSDAHEIPDPKKPLEFY
jgi:uncharacterized ion transporter superfamily protein YfcC